MAGGKDQNIDIRGIEQSELKVSSEHVEATEGWDKKRLLLKLDLYILPALCLTYALSLVDRTNISAAKIVGLERDLSLKGDQFSVALLVFFITYTLVEIPSNAILRRFPTKYYLSLLIFCWGVIAMCFGFVQNFSQLVALRVLLGTFEGGFNPACVYVISCWYKRYEVQRRLAIWFTLGSFISGFTGVLSYGLSLMDGKGGLAGWRWIFIIPGILTVLMAIPIFFYVVDFPDQSTFLSKAEKQFVLYRLETDRGVPVKETPSWAAFWATVRDPKIIIMSIMHLAPTGGSYALAFFTPSILAGFGFSTALSQILTTPPYVFSAIFAVATGALADRMKVRTPFIVGCSLLVIVGLVMVGWGNNTGARLCGVFLAIAGNNSAIPAVLAFLSNNVVGQSKRQFAVPLQTVFGGLGGIVGSLIFRPQDYPAYRPGLYSVFGLMVLNMILAPCLSYYMYCQNRKADKEGIVLEGVPGFRYTL